MARVEISEAVISSSGSPVTGASVQVNVRNGAAATVYAAQTGATTVTNPIVTDNGRIEGWLDEGSYDLVVNGYTQRYEAVAGTSVAGAATTSDAIVFALAFGG